MNYSTTEHDTTKLLASLLSQSTAHSYNIDISYPGKLLKISENALIIYRLGISSKYCHFHNVLKTLNNSYQQTRHLELNRMVQTFFSQYIWLPRCSCLRSGSLRLDVWNSDSISMSNSATEHNTRIIVTSFHSELNAHSNDTNI